MWVRSEFGGLVNLAQASEVTLEGGTVQAHINGQARPLAHRANEAEARKIFEIIAQELESGKSYLDVSLGPRRSGASTDTAANVPAATSSA
jgi:hypothetical protein